MQFSISKKGRFLLLCRSAFLALLVGAFLFAQIPSIARGYAVLCPFLLGFAALRTRCWRLTLVVEDACPEGALVIRAGLVVRVVHRIPLSGIRNVSITATPLGAALAQRDVLIGTAGRRFALPPLARCDAAVLEALVFGKCNSNGGAPDEK